MARRLWLHWIGVLAFLVAGCAPGGRVGERLSPEQLGRLTAMTNQVAIRKHLKTLSAADGSYTNQAARVVLYHNLALSDRDKALTRAMLDKTAAIHKRYPNDPLVTAFHGSLMTLMGRDERESVKRMRYVREGLKLLDKAVSLAPRDPALRLMRARNNYALPSFFGRLQQVIGDLVWLTTRYQAGKLRFPKTNMGRLYFQLGECQRRSGNMQAARRAWQRALELAPQAPWARQARLRVADGGGTGP